MHYEEIYLTHTIRQAEPEDPFLVFNSLGNLVTRAPVLSLAKEKARQNRIKELVKELSDITDLREYGG